MASTSEKSGLKCREPNFSNMIIMIKIIILSEGSQTGKDKCHMIWLTCGTLNNDTNALIYKTNRFIGTENKHLLTI